MQAFPCSLFAAIVPLLSLIPSLVPSLHSQLLFEKKLGVETGNEATSFPGSTAQHSAKTLGSGWERGYLYWHYFTPVHSVFHRPSLYYLYLSNTMYRYPCNCIIHVLHLHLPHPLPDFASVPKPSLQPLLFPCGSTRRETLPSNLRQAGVALHCLDCYDTVADPGIEENLRRLAEQKVGIFL